MHHTPLLLAPTLLRAQHEFSFALLRQVAQASPRANLFLSPFSVGLALLLALEGSTDAAHAALACTLRLTELPPAQLASKMAQLLALLETEGDYQPTLHVANGLWVDKRFPLSPAFAARLRQYYRAEAATLDFAASEAADGINRWVSEHTQGRITGLVAPGTLSPAAPLVLGNAVYFKGSWAVEFDEAATRPGPFTLADGQQLTVPLMQLRSRQPGYLRGPGWQAVRLRYQGYPRGASMLLLVPDQPTGLPALLASLSADSWAGWLTEMAAATEPVEVDLTLPRFQLDWELNLTAALAALGLGPALAPSADFAPMGFPPDLPGFIGQIAHKTYLRVDEQGTEAAGATALFMAGGATRPTAPRRVVVRADHPFFCAIVDDETDVILFAGAVYRP